ncbi:hypothetical protein RZE82_04050 [Mollicutes bacterium LVI A0039]|nr:hypothetical protein RZE82_04050 [Mollicutes bacterium LVI A0039]
MLKGYSERRFRKKFPNLKQVINESELDFHMRAQVPLRYGENQVYLKAEDGRRTVITDFNVDGEHQYGLKIVYNYPYIIEKIKTQFLMTIIAVIFIAIAMQILITPYFKYIYLVNFVVTIFAYMFIIEYYIGKLGISAYKIDVVQSKK